jgi:hypothetical protein
MRIFFLRLYAENKLRSYAVKYFLKFLICTVCIENKPKGCLVSKRFVPPRTFHSLKFGLPDVLSYRTFSPSGRFVLPDVLSFRTFCPSGRFVLPDVLSFRTFCLWTFFLWTFCPSGRFVSGRFVWAPRIDFCNKLLMHALLKNFQMASGIIFLVGCKDEMPQCRGHRGGGWGRGAKPSKPKM